LGENCQTFFFVLVIFFLHPGFEGPLKPVNHPSNECKISNKYLINQDNCIQNLCCPDTGGGNREAVIISRVFFSFYSGAGFLLNIAFRSCSN
jgi:hypothetical protein